jgi:hypothetical protein
VLFVFEFLNDVGSALLVGVAVEVVELLALLRDCVVVLAGFID